MPKKLQTSPNGLCPVKLNTRYDKGFPGDTIGVPLDVAEHLISNTFVPEGQDRSVPLAEAVEVPEIVRVELKRPHNDFAAGAVIGLPEDRALRAVEAGQAELMDA